MSVPRKLRHRPPIAIAPLVASQLNCKELLGLNDSRFLQLFRTHPSARRFGKLLLVEVGDAVEVVRNLPRDPTAVDVADTDDTDEDLPQTANEVLGKLGLRVAR